MDRHLQTIFCDDVRHELGGKISYIGVYSGRLFLPSFPLALPKLCLAMNVLTPANRPFTKLCLRVMKDEGILFEGEFNDAQLSDAVEITSDSEMDIKDRILSLQSIIVFSPLALEGPCTLRVLAETEDGELRGAGLKIEQASSDVKISQ